MARRWPKALQLTIFVLLVAGSVAVWVKQSEVKDAIAAFMPGDQEQTQERGRRGRGGDTERGVPVIVSAVQSREDVAVVTAVGTARARRAVMLMAKAEGVLVSLEVQAGERVTTGEPLFTVDDTKAKLAVQIAQKQLDDAKRVLERSKYLRERNINSGAPVEDAESAVRRAALQLRQAEELLGDLTVEAPFSGVVGIPKVEVGDRVTTSTSVVSIDDRSELIIEFEIPERFLPRIHAGDQMKVMTPSYRNRKFDGSISSIDSRIDPVSRSVAVRAAVPNPEDLLRPGMSFTIALRLPGETYPAVPELSLQWEGSRAHVWLVRDRAAEKVEVIPVRRLNQEVLVTGAVKPGDTVVVEGVQRLRPGRPVSFDGADAPVKSAEAEQDRSSETAGP